LITVQGCEDKASNPVPKMRLINTSTLELHDFLGDHFECYAILSHRWDDHEVTFQQLRDGQGPQTKGWNKIVGCCAKAAADGWPYVVSNGICFKSRVFIMLNES